MLTGTWPGICFPSTVAAGSSCKSNFQRRIKCCKGTRVIDVAALPCRGGEPAAVGLGVNTSKSHHVMPPPHLNINYIMCVASRLVSETCCPHHVHSHQMPAETLTLLCKCVNWVHAADLLQLSLIYPGVRHRRLLTRRIGIITAPSTWTATWTSWSSSWPSGRLPPWRRRSSAWQPLPRRKSRQGAPAPQLLRSAMVQRDLSLASAPPEPLLDIRSAHLPRLPVTPNPGQSYVPGLPPHPMAMRGPCTTQQHCPPARPPPPPQPHPPR